MKHSMKKIMKRTLIILIVIVILFILVIGVFIVCNNKHSKNELTFYLSYESSYDTGWSYRLSEENIIQEIENDDYDMLWGDDIRYWMFEPVNPGIVTIYFDFRYESVVVEEKCFSITYCVDEDNNITKDSNESIQNDNVEFIKEPMELFWVKCNNFFTKTVKVIIAFILSLFI